MSSFSSPDDLNRFITETRKIMGELGFEEAATAMGEVQATAYTTSSEWLGELGATVRRIELQFRLPDNLQERLDRIMTEVHRAWPTL